MGWRRTGWLLLRIFVVAAMALMGWHAGLTLRGAPAPLPKPKPAPQVAAGRWVLVWSGDRYDMTLSPGGAYEAVSAAGGGSRWVGSWRWCPEARVLTIAETEACLVERRQLEAMAEGRPLEHGLTCAVRMPPGSLKGGRGRLAGGGPVTISLEPAGKRPRR
jgi:hypothetical protein